MTAIVQTLTKENNRHYPPTPPYFITNIQHIITLQTILFWRRQVEPKLYAHNFHVFNRKTFKPLKSLHQFQIRKRHLLRQGLLSNDRIHFLIRLHLKTRFQSWNFTESQSVNVCMGGPYHMAALIIWRPLSYVGPCHMAALVICRPLSYGGPCHMSALIIWRPLSYGGPYHMAALVICRPLSYGGPYHMAALIIWRPLSYGGPYHMAALIIWRPLSYGGPCHMAALVIWRPLSYGGPCHMAALVICRPLSYVGPCHMSALVICRPLSYGGHVVKIDSFY